MSSLVLPSLFFATVALSPEIPVSPPVITTAPYEQHIVSVASNGHDFLALWVDRRSKNPYLNPSSPGPLYISKLDRSGRVMNPFGTKIVDAAFGSALVHTNLGYVIVWSDGTGTHMMLLDDNGTSIGPPTDLFGGYIVSAASNGNTIFMLHGAYSQPTLLSVYRPDGTLVSNAPLSNAANLRPMMSLVLPGGDYALLANVWDCPGAVPCIVTATLITMSESGTTSTKPLQQISQW